MRPRQRKKRLDQLGLRLASDEIIVDSFAGGGGASLGIMWALGYSPHVAINHDREAIALHAANHPDSQHFAEDVWHVDPIEACKGRPVGLMWLSPDCKHFSKAKGGKPVSKKIRGLAWTAVRWAKAVQPRVIALENVEEFRDWGPVSKVTNRPCPERKGQTFRAFRRRLERLGYAVEHRELRACDYGAPTIRKRFFLIARCDGRPIMWPEPTHGQGRAFPHRTAAECIDWSLPCPSIFLTRAEAREYYRATGDRIKRPLAANTMRRIARGITKYVLNSPRPFIVGVGGRQGQSPERDLDRPYQTITAKADSAIIVPHITKFRNNSTGSAIDEPMPTVTANSYIKRPGGAVPLGVVAPYLVPTAHAGDARVHSVEDPMRTITGAHRGEHALVAPTLIQTGYGEDKHRNGGLGQPPRSLDLHAPLGTVVGCGIKHALVTSFLAKHQSERHAHETQAASLDDAMPTVKTRDSTALVTSSLIKLKGTAKDGQPVDEPLHTVQAGGNHYGEVRAFLMKYHANGGQWNSLHDPMPTAVANDSIALVVVDGVEYAIADIGMRMLAPRELYRAQGFPDTYRIDIEYEGEPLSKEAQVRMCGNSVCPPLAAAIVAANLLGETFARPRERAA